MKYGKHRSTLHINTPVGKIVLKIEQINRRDYEECT